MLRSEGLAPKDRNQVTVIYGIRDLETAALQSQTDQLHARLVEKLRAAGYEVVPQAELEGTAGWRKLLSVGKPSGSPFKSESGSGLMFAAAGAPYYFYPGDPHLGAGAISWGFAQAQVAEQQMATELNASLLTVRIVVALKETERHSQAFALLRSASSFEGAPWVALDAPASAAYLVVPGKTGGLMKPTGRASLALKDSLLFPEDLLSPTLQEATSGAGKAGNAASTALFAGMVLANMAGAGAGGKLYKSYRFEAAPPQADYLAAVQRNAAAFEDAVLSQLTLATD